MAEAKPKKKVVKVQSDPAVAKETTWKATPEAKSKALKLRLIALALWIVAIGAEAFAIFWVLKQDSINFWLLIGLLVVIAALAIGGSLLWKKSNRLDPASEKDKVRFFVQNQLGAIIAVIAFLPLIILIFLNKDLDGKQKGIAGGIGIALLLVAGFIGTDLNPPSQEKYDQQTKAITELTGQDLVFWTKSGSVYHLCKAVSAVNQESQDNQIYEGTVATAQGENKSRLTKQFASEAATCGFALEPGTQLYVALEVASGSKDPSALLEFDGELGESDDEPSVAPSDATEEDTE